MRNALLFALVGIALTGCARRKHARIVPPPPPAHTPVNAPSNSGPPAGTAPALPFPAQPKAGDIQTGIASWYGHPYHGRQAADGEVYDMEELVAAHRTLPFQTWVRVVNLVNEKTVDVRIIDRGPFIEGRIIDLSHAAARAIDLIGPGIGPVRVEVIRAADTAAVRPGARRMPPVSPPIPVAGAAARTAFAVQVGVFQDRANAERVRAGMEARYGSARIVRREGDREMWRVLVGSEATEDGAAALSTRIRQESGERNAFVVRLDS